jgi:hypothetical protein
MGGKKMKDFLAAALTLIIGAFLFVLMIQLFWSPGPLHEEQAEYGVVYDKHLRLVYVGPEK